MTPTGQIDLVHQEQAADLWRRAQAVREVLAGTMAHVGLGLAAPAVVEEWARLAGLTVDRCEPYADEWINGGQPIVLVAAEWKPEGGDGPTIRLQTWEPAEALPYATPAEDAR